VPFILFEKLVADARHFEQDDVVSQRPQRSSGKQPYCRNGVCAVRRNSTPT
jgi:hypothetical protein